MSEAKFKKGDRVYFNGKFEPEVYILSETIKEVKEGSGYKISTFELDWYGEGEFFGSVADLRKDLIKRENERHDRCLYNIMNAEEEV